MDKYVQKLCIDSFSRSLWFSIYLYLWVLNSDWNKPFTFNGTKLNVKRVWTNNQFRQIISLGWNELNNEQCICLFTKLFRIFLCCFGDNSFSLDFDHTSIVAFINYWKWKLFTSLFVGDSFLFDHFESVIKNVKTNTQCKRLYCNFCLLKILKIWLTNVKKMNTCFYPKIKNSNWAKWENSN